MVKISNINNDHWIFSNINKSIEKQNNSKHYIGSSNYENIINNNNQSTYNQITFDELNKKAWNNTLIPLKSMGMTFFMLYMSGSNAGIFSILVILYALVNAIKILIKVNQTFFELENIAKKNFFIQRLFYILNSLLGIFFILYKLGNLGLIPINRSDYIFNLPPHETDELVIIN